MRSATAICCLALAALLSGAARASVFDPFGMAGIDEPPGGRVPMDLVFRDEDGRHVTLRDLARGKPIILAPVLHDCPNICGVTLRGLAEAVLSQKLVPGRDFAVVAFGLDPREGPAEAQRDLARLTAAAPGLPREAVHAVVGRESEIKAVTAALGYRYAWDARIAQYAHVAAIAVLSADGELARWLDGPSPEPGDLRAALDQAAQGDAGAWRRPLLLLCYLYDPRTGRYGWLVWLMLRLGGGLLVVAGALFIGSLLLRDRRRRSR